MTANPPPIDRRQAFRQAAVDAGGEIGGLSARLAARLQSGRVRLSAALAVGALGLLWNVVPALADGSGASGATGCASNAATSLLTLTNDASIFLIGAGASISILMFALGALFIIFGVTPRHVYKGQEMIKQTIIGLAVLAGGVFIKTVIVDVVFQTNASTIKTTC